MNAARHEEELHAFLDQELSEEERTRVEQELPSAEDQANLQAFAQIGDLLRQHAEQASEELPSEDLFAAIRGRVDDDVRLGRGYMRVVQGGEQRQQRRVFTGVGVVLAIAAALVLGLFARRPDAPIAENVPDAGEPGGSVVAVLEEPTLGSEVDEEDFGGNAGTVFAVEGAQGQPDRKSVA